MMRTRKKRRRQTSTAKAIDSIENKGDAEKSYYYKRNKRRMTNIARVMFISFFVTPTNTRHENH